MARQPCRAALVAPTGHRTAHDAHLKTDHALQLDFVYGYRAHDARHNVAYNADGLVVYPAAATGVLRSLGAAGLSLVKDLVVAGEGEGAGDDARDAPRPSLQFEVSGVTEESDGTSL